MLKARKYLVLIAAILILFNSLSFAAILGDVNGNEKLDLADAIIILQTLVGLRTANVTGTWTGTTTQKWADNTTTSGPMTLVLSQNGKTVTGTMTIEVGRPPGNITGSVDGNNFTFSFAAGGTGAMLTLGLQVNDNTMTASSASGFGSPGTGAQIQISSWSGTLTKGTSTTLNLAGTWDYAGNIVATDGNVESHVGKATVAQNSSNVANFSMIGTWHSSKTGNTGADDIAFSSNVTSSGLAIIPMEINCNDGTSTCLCTLSGSGSGNANALTVDINIASKTCNAPFTATTRLAFTK
jgi:hypothetical protein